MDHEKVNILLVDDQPAKLLAYEVILRELGENLVVAASGREALEYLLKNEVAVILVEVCMPELDGFELAAMIREHPRFQKTAMIFISAIQVSELDRLRGYEMGAVDYVPVPVIPAVLRAKIRVFAELYRKTRQMERFNAELEDRVRARTAELEESHARLLESERRRSLAIAAGRMGSWDWDWVNGDWLWDEGQYRIFGVDPKTFVVTPASVQALLHPDDIDELLEVTSEIARLHPQSINDIGWPRYHAFLHKAVRYYCGDSPMEEVQNPAMNSLEADSELVNSVTQEIGFGPPQFVPHFPQPLQSEVALVLYLRGQLAEPFQEWA